MRLIIFRGFSKASSRYCRLLTNKSVRDQVVGLHGCSRLIIVVKFRWLCSVLGWVTVSNFHLFKGPIVHK